MPVGIKSAVGEMGFWYELTRLMARGDRGVDFVTIDGGEGGTGASPPIFADSIALPFRMGFSRVYGTFAEAGLTDDVTFIGSGQARACRTTPWSRSRSAPTWSTSPARR